MLPDSMSYSDSVLLTVSQCTWRCEVLPDLAACVFVFIVSLSQCTWRCEVLPDPYPWKPRHTATSRLKIATGPASTPRNRLAPGQNYHLSLKTSQAPPTPPKPPPATNFQRSHAEKSGSKRTKLCTVDQIATSPPRPTSTTSHSRHRDHHKPRTETGTSNALLSAVEVCAVRVEDRFSTGRSFGMGGFSTGGWLGVAVLVGVWVRLPGAGIRAGAPDSPRQGPH